jgi:hypothetical protein
MFQKIKEFVVGQVTDRNRMVLMGVAIVLLIFVGGWLSS